MSRYYQNLDRPFIDYGIIEMPGIPRPIRGPAVDLERPFAVCIGAAQTFGRFCEYPYPRRLEEMLGIPVLNLAVGGTGPGFYRGSAFLHVLRRARLVVAQVLSGRSASNSEFITEGDIQGWIPSKNSVGRLEPLMDEFLRTRSRDFIDRIVAETRHNFVEQYRLLLQEIERPTILFWFTNRVPAYRIGYGAVHELMGPYPQLVDDITLSAIKPLAASYVECTGSQGFPQRLWRADIAVEGTRRGEDGWLYNHYYPTQEMHDNAATSLLPACSRLLDL